MKRTEATMTDKDYIAAVKDGRDICPACSDGDIYWYEPETNKGEARYSCQCQYCGTRWEEVYELVRYELINGGRLEDIPS